MYVILVYDIKTDDGGQRVLNRTFKICKKYLCHIQNSVFEGELSEAQIVKLNYELKKVADNIIDAAIKAVLPDKAVIRADRDSIILFKSRSDRWLSKEMWGKDDDKTSNFI